MSLEYKHEEIRPRLVFPSYSEPRSSQSIALVRLVRGMLKDLANIIPGLNWSSFTLFLLASHLLFTSR